MPTALKTMSDVIFLFSLLLVLISNSTPESVNLELITSEEVKKVIPFFFKFFSNSLEISLSSTGTILF